MRLWKMELYKITARPVLNGGFILILGFLMLIFLQEAKGTRTEIDGTVYYVNGRVRFGYIAGWQWMREVWMMAALTLNLWLILVTAPVFSEEYSRNTVGILLATEHGKARDIREKITAAVGFGVLMYVLVTAVFFLMTLVIYGSDGLDASAALSIDFFWIAPSSDLSMGRVLLVVFLEGLAAVILNICMVLFISSKCRNTVSALTAGLLLYLLPHFLNKVVFQLLIDMRIANYFLGWIFLDSMRIFSCSMPLYLLRLEGFNLPAHWLALIPPIVIFLTILSIWRAYANYKNYQVK